MKSYRDCKGGWVPEAALPKSLPPRLLYASTNTSRVCYEGKAAGRALPEGIGAKPGEANIATFFTKIRSIEKVKEQVVVGLNLT